MKGTDLELWGNITFKTLAYRKNYDFISTNENIITLYEGMVSELRLNEKIFPKPIGEYGFSVWNVELAKTLNANIYDLIKEHKAENTYNELIEVIENRGLDVFDYKKIVFLNSFVLKKEYRKRGITEELVEMLYRDFYADDVAVIVLAKPFQDNNFDGDFFLKDRQVRLNDTRNRSNEYLVPAADYYSLTELLDNKDSELNEYKLFAIAKNCGFWRLSETNLFILKPEKIIKRLQKKYKLTQVAENK